MKHPVRDRILIFIYALATLLCAACLAGMVTGNVNLAADSAGFDGRTVGLPIASLLQSWSQNGMTLQVRIVLIVVCVVLVLLALLLIGVMIPSRNKKKSSTFAVQHNDNGMVRVSLKAIETLVQRCLGEHTELKVVTSSLFSDEETVRVDVHIILQSDISMPMAISSLQQQLKKYLEACAGIVVKEVRVFVDGAVTVSEEEIMKSPFAIPSTILAVDALPSAAKPTADAKADDGQTAGAQTKDEDKTGSNDDQVVVSNAPEGTKPDAEVTVMKADAEDQDKSENA